MKTKIKAILLSAFVLPGLGQLYLERKIKGAVLILLVNIFILFALAVVLRSLLPIVLEMQNTGRVDIQQLLQRVKGTPAVKWTLLSFFALWGYSIFDIIIGSSGGKGDE